MWIAFDPIRRFKRAQKSSKFNHRSPRSCVISDALGLTNLKTSEMTHDLGNLWLNYDFWARLIEMVILMVNRSMDQKLFTIKYFVIFIINFKYTWIWGSSFIRVSETSSFSEGSVLDLRFHRFARGCFSGLRPRHLHKWFHLAIIILFILLHLILYI